MDRYEKFKENINNLININLNYYKEKQMKRRITSLMNRNGFDDFEEYFKGLKSDKKLLEQFINYLTINVSEFYRNPSQWKVLEMDILPNLISNKNKPLKVWSSACSTGEEPYSLVMLMNKFYDLMDINILATDIDEEALSKAKIGIYSEKALVNLPSNMQSSYFDKVGNSYRIKDEVKKCVEFKKIDLLKDPFPNNVDLILCRNVMIYFTDEAKEILYEKFHRSLSSKGILFVGSTEQIILPERYNFRTVKTFFYTKID
ncbi:CheR family methyltransferase [Tepidimicrobium xylanilyticum]|uniref:protein-glutamate O-methyltransferase n=1 Tax=Tepidimicrobium xylanilyticum TaxID=1123352 RepID=A0A1H3CZ52_9FIRM|nr:protein-glutamate O-methyltransferase CheR [Tepidimicrobium xylanilyticum]GMG97764.1 chemotaxis protein methyltransferase [Tepidimicrobium xylanilyticum]SDX58834.1 chemotaxis protein methyltransferase CheR [Tepidimicrobium xylanilyticum]